MPPSAGKPATSGGSGNAGKSGGGTAGKGGSTPNLDGHSGAAGTPGEAGRSPTAGGPEGGRSAEAGASGSSGNHGYTSMEPPSCAASGPGLTTCGEDGTESCCASLLVEGGTYARTYRNTGNGPSGEGDRATLSTYRLDKYEVSVARFREYVKYLEAGGSPPVAGSGKHRHLNDGDGLRDSGRSGSFEPGWDERWNNRIPSGAGATNRWKTLLTSRGSSTEGGCHLYGTFTTEPGENDLLPITCTSWYESYAFCIWDDGFLPSEAEWKYAAAGGDEQRAYPWGSEAPGSRNEYAIYDCCYPSGRCSGAAGRDTCTGIENVAPVGFTKKGTGRYGQADLIGSVWEWNLDRYANYVNPCEDCAYLTGNTSNRVLPGSGFHTGASLGGTLMYSFNRASVSFDADSYRGDYAVGVRCARAP